MTRFLRDLIAIPGESCGEKDVILRIRDEMEKLGFDSVEIDPMGNILGYMGSGKTLIVIAAGGGGIPVKRQYGNLSFTARLI